MLPSGGHARRPSLRRSPPRRPHRRLRRAPLGRARPLVAPASRRLERGTARLHVRSGDAAGPARRPGARRRGYLLWNEGDRSLSLDGDRLSRALHLDEGRGRSIPPSCSRRGSPILASHRGKRRRWPRGSRPPPAAESPCSCGSTTRLATGSDRAEPRSRPSETTSTPSCSTSSTRRSESPPRGELWSGSAARALS